MKNLMTDGMKSEIQIRLSINFAVIEKLPHCTAAKFKTDGLKWMRKRSLGPRHQSSRLWMF